MAAADSEGRAPARTATIESDAWLDEVRADLRRMLASAQDDETARIRLHEQDLPDGRQVRHAICTVPRRDLSRQSLFIYGGTSDDPSYVCLVIVPEMWDQVVAAARELGWHT
jgi:hypothetical protein